MPAVPGILPFVLRIKGETQIRKTHYYESAFLSKLKIMDSWSTILTEKAFGSDKGEPVRYQDRSIRMHLRRTFCAHTKIPTLL